MDKIYNFLLETWRANLESNLHPLIKIILAVFMWALPLATAIEIFKYLTLEGWTSIVLICTTIVLSISTMYLYRNRYDMDKQKRELFLKESELNRERIQLDFKKTEVQHSIVMKDGEIIDLKFKLDKLIVENNTMSEKLNTIENQKKEELLTLEKQNNAIKELAQKQTDEQIKTIESDYNKKLADEKQVIEKELKSKYEDLKANFERQYLEDVERSAKEKAKEFINKELPFDI